MRTPAPRVMLFPNLPVRFPRARPRAADKSQAWLASLCVLTVFGAAFMAMNSKYLFRTAPPAQTQSVAELYTGSIQLAPSRENRCRRMSFDNRSGRMQDLGTVSCGAATAVEPEVPPQGSRIDQIRDAFRNR